MCLLRPERRVGAQAGSLALGRLQVLSSRCPDGFSVKSSDSELFASEEGLPPEALSTPSNRSP